MDISESESLESVNDDFEDGEEGEYEQESVKDEEGEYNLQLDNRILWIRDRVMKILGLSGYDHLFHDLINANNRKFEDKLMTFLTQDLYGVMDLERKVIYFYKTYHAETVQEEVSVWEETTAAQRAKITALSIFTTKGRAHRLTKSAPGKVFNEDDKRKVKKSAKKMMKKSKSKMSKIDTTPIVSTVEMSMSTLQAVSTSGTISLVDADEKVEEEEEERKLEDGMGDSKRLSRKKVQSKSAPSDSSSFVPPPGEEDKYILTKKIVERVRKVPVLHLIFGQVDANRQDLLDINLFYFMRTTEEGVPAFNSYVECWDLITSYLIVGSLNGKFLPSMTNLLVQVFKPLVENQFRGPSVGEGLKREEVNAESATGDRIVSDTLSAALRRPSDFRRMSLSISKKERQRQEEGTSTYTTFEERSSSGEKKLKSISISRSGKRIKSAASIARSNQSTTMTGSKGEQRKFNAHPEQCKTDIMQYLERLISCVEWTLEHVEGDVLLTMPEIPELHSATITDDMLAKNKDMIEQMEEVVMSWTHHIQKVLDSYRNKARSGKGPMAEYDYWYEKEADLSMLVEQLKMPIVRRILAILNKVLSPIASAFEHFQTDLWKRYSEAKENNKFLSTVLRFFKLIANSDSFKLIADCLPALTNGLRMTWILSAYYSSEEKMTQLFERISWQLCQNVTNNLSVTQLFKDPLEVVLRKTQDTHRMMKNWKASYMKTREDIEFSGKGVRWEFDQKRLFSGTEYIAYVCNDLNKVANVLDDFNNIFGDDLRSIINDPAQIDAIVKRVATLINPFEEADFDLFNEFNRENWIAMMTAFNEEVKFLESEAKFYIDECFMALISAEDALEVLMKLKKIKTRESIKEQLSNKFNVVMQQFSKEIGIVENIYNRGKKDPPLLRYHPPTAGAIYWVRQLFHRLKRSVLIFQKVPELKHNDVKLMAFSQYVDIAKRMKVFEEGKFNAWVDKAQYTVTHTMKKSVLKMVRSEPEKGALTFPFDDKLSQSKSFQMSESSKRSKSKEYGSQGYFIMTPQGSAQKADGIISKPSVDTAGSSGHTVSKMIWTRGQTRSDLKPETKVSGHSQKDAKFNSEPSLVDRQSGHPTKVTWLEFMRRSISLECQLRFNVNFDWNVFEVIHEAELMEQLGFELPAVVRDIGIQKDRLRTDITVMEKVINEYNSIIDRLDKPDIQLLRNTLLKIEKRIQPGVTRLNWNSLNIAEYAASCGKLLKTFKSTVSQVNEMKKDLDSRIESEMQSYNLFSVSPESAMTGELLHCESYFMEVEKRRADLVFAMLKMYHSISPMLIKLESLVEGTSTGSSPCMQLLYEKYTKRIFVAFITYMISNLELFNKMLNENKSLFLVDAVLVASEVLLRPSPNEVFSIILRNVKDLLECLKVFPRWMQGTCIECKPIKKDNSEEMIIFSFFEDVMSVQIVNDAIIAVQDSAHKIALDCGNYLRRWKKYYNLWSYEKNTVCGKFAATGPTLLQYDEKFTFYDGLLEELKDMTDYYDITSVRINLKPLLRGIEEHAREWKQVLGNYLLADTAQSMWELKETIEHYRAEVELIITGLDRFTLIMQAIADVKKMAIQAEVQYTTYQETYQTVRSHDIEYNKADEEMAYTLQQDWESLYLGALYRAATLESTCYRFSEMTQEQIQEFSKLLAEFAKDFDVNGPGSVGDDLNLGLKKMDEYSGLVGKHEEKRLNLVNAETLFDLPPADYSDFLRIKKEVEGMESIYSLYKQQRNAREVWAKTLWINLNPQQLIDGMEQFMREFRKLPKNVRNINVGKALDANMRSFKNSVPLFVELKNEAMRERHWQELMAKTGQHFDMDPDRCED